MMLKEFCKGSEWRKWDLHVHAPGTKLNDQYKLEGGDVLEEFCKKVEESDVKAFGITDYFSGDGYFAFIEKYRRLYPNSSKIFFPNIELRTSDVVNAAREEVNLHVIFNPSQPDLRKNLEKFLQNLKTNKTTGKDRKIKTSELCSEQDFEEATTTRAYIKEALKEVYGDEAELLEYVMIFAAANNDGIRTETEEIHGKKRGVKRKAVITDEIDKFCDGFFGNSNNSEYFLTPNRLENKKEAIEPKPVVSGCDAHSFEDVENWLGKLVGKDSEILKEPTWIKADLTYEGLKQIIYEPGSRVFIGTEPDIEARVRENPTKYIKSIHIDQIESYGGRHGTWFHKTGIELNKEMVAIIGNKGSGKSALTDIVGLLGNSHNQKYDAGTGKTEELFSFLNREKFLKGHCASNFEADLNWYYGDPEHAILDRDTDTGLPEKVEYLPQKYLEKICANIEDDEFRRKLNEVVFDYVEKKDRYGTSSLEDLLEYLTRQASEEISDVQVLLHEKNEEVVEVEKKLTSDYRREIEERKKIKEEEIAAHEFTKPPEIQPPREDNSIHDGASTEISKLEALMGQLSTQIDQLRSEQPVVSKRVEDLRQAKQTIERQIKALTDLKPKYVALLKEIGVTFEDAVSVRADFTKLDSAIKGGLERLAEISALLRSSEDVEAIESEEEKNIAFKKSLVCQYEGLEVKHKEIVDRLDKPLRDYQAYLKVKAKWDTRRSELTGDDEDPGTGTLNWLKQELERIENDYPHELQIARENREKVSKDIYAKKKGLISFYIMVKQAIDTEITKYKKELGDYNISIDAGLRFDSSFIDNFFEYVNQRSVGSFSGAEEGKTVLKKICEEVDDWQDEAKIFSMLADITSHLDQDKRGEEVESSRRDIFRQMKQQKDPVAFYDYLFGLDYLQTKYDLMVDDKDLSQLSPGERGGLLLIFYLMLDRKDVPLVIDQPEDNLDNKSVYEILVRFIKKAKKRRQIIMATHNPNLAVVADAEQIIHVSIDKKNKNDFGFYSGSIENLEINKRVVDILEGTLPAFDNRRLKYRKRAH